MSSTVHDLRVLLRDKTKTIEELEKKISELRTNLDKNSLLLKENLELLTKKDEIISMKDSILKEKDNQIMKLENELSKLKNIKPNDFNTNTNSKTSVLASSPSINKISQFQTENLSPSSVNILKSKRLAISAEPAQNRFNKSKELRASLKEYPKSEK
jgi:hypothetical protein